jgi:2-enoate reductase
VCVQDAYSGQNYQEITPSTDLKKIVILGAGIAGLEAARVAKLRGHEVEIYEKSNRIGGIMPLVAAEYKKEEFIKIVNYLDIQLKKLNVPIHLNKELTREELVSLNPDLLVLATGTEAKVPVKYEENPNILTQDEAILNGKRLGKNIVVWGLNSYWKGGAETAITLAKKGYNVKALIGPEAIVAQIISGGPGRKYLINHYLKESNIKVYPIAKLLDVNEKGVKFYDKERTEHFIEADALVYCGSRISNGKKLKKEFEGVSPEIILIGDCKKPRDIKEALTDAQTFARNLK